MRRSISILLIVVSFLLAGCSRTASKEPEMPSGQVTVSEVADISSDDPGELTEEEKGRYTVKTAYANWSDDALIREISLNPEKLVSSSEYHLPVYVFNSKADLDRFRTAVSDILTTDHGYNEIPSFNEMTEGYDDSFFAEYSVILAYMPSSSGSFRYDIDSITVKGTYLCVNLVQTNDPETYTSDMAGWFIMAEADKSVIRDCTSYDAKLLQNGQDQKYVTLPGHMVFGTFSWEEVERNISELDEGSFKRVRTDGFVNTSAGGSGWPTDRAKEETEHDYKLAQCFRDEEADMWMVRFFDSEDSGPFEEIYITGDGITKLIVSGEMTTYGAG